MPDKIILKSKFKKFWEEHEIKVVLVFGFVLVAILSFEAGIIKGQKMPRNPLIIEKPVENNTVAPAQNAPEAQNSTQKVSGATSDSNTISPQNCAYVASKNSNKFHLASCRYAKSIKAENKVCFSSPDEAQSKGYLPDKNCIK